MLRFSGSSQNPGSSVLDELQLSNGLLWKAGEETITIIHPAGDKGMNKFLQVVTGNKTSNSCSISAFYTGVLKARLCHDSDVPHAVFYTEMIHDLILDILLLYAHLQEIVKWILLLRIIAWVPNLGITFEIPIIIWIIIWKCIWQDIYLS